VTAVAQDDPDRSSTAAARPTTREVRHAAVVFLLLALVLPAPAAAKAPRAQRGAVPNDPLWRSEWGPHVVSMTTVWRRPTLRRVVVAVVDTGVDATQPDLAGRLVPGWNTLTDSADTADDNGHGTMVAGVIAARSNNGLGVAGYCASCSIMPVKALDAAGQGPGSAIAAGIDWAVAHGAGVVNLSLVLTSDDSGVDAAVARAVGAGVVVVAAAGNGGTATPTYPAVLPGVLAVGAVDPAGALYPWSNSGDWVSVRAPGCNATTFAGGGFGEFCGTSSAAAATSGVVGAVLAATTSTAQALTAAVAGAGRLNAALLVH
jgi:subtilisin family serine protease